MIVPSATANAGIELGMKCVAEPFVPIGYFASSSSGYARAYARSMPAIFVPVSITTGSRPLSDGIGQTGCDDCLRTRDSDEVCGSSIERLLGWLESERDFVD